MIMAKKRTCIYLLILLVLTSCSRENKKVVLVSGKDLHPRIEFGKGKLIAALEASGYELEEKTSPDYDPELSTILIGQAKDDLEKEGFTLASRGKAIVVSGADETGTLYGCLELAKRIRSEGELPLSIQISDEPEMVLRGTCIGLQKTEYLPGRQVYEYPYTPENFPWFYDKAQWVEYLDMLVENRFNSLYLWNGHPFASLVKLDDFPYAMEVDDETFELNREIFLFITEEAHKRGIWVIQMFYNIIVSKPFAEHHGILTQERSRPIIPVVADYTRKSIAAFIENYPNVGLMVCLGEAMHSIEDDVEWFTETIIPGVKDGLGRLGVTQEPPIVLRGHDTDPEEVMQAALPVYRNLYTTAKYNGESLTTYVPRDSWASIHQTLSRLGSVHMSNVHILANLEPFRYGSPDFIQKSTQAMHDIQGANGLHLYPQASYWDWPYTADRAEPRLKQIDRDWIWYKAWGRYAWDSRRDRGEEVDYWSAQLGGYYDCGKSGKDILEAYEQMGEIAPKLLRRFGISDGNRQTLLLGMLMSQLVNPYKWNVYSNFYSSNGPEGEILVDYARKEWKGETLRGELPLQITGECLEHGRLAVEAIDRAVPRVRTNREEFRRLRNDVYCYNAFARFFHEKVNAALRVLRYKYSRDISDLEAALPYLEKSLEYWEELAGLTRDSYLYANSMQTQQRRIPITGRDGSNKTWSEMLIHYRNELGNFKRNLATLRAGGPAGKAAPLLQPAEVRVLNEGLERFSVIPGEKVYADRDYRIREAAGELNLLKGIRFEDRRQQDEGTVLRFECDRPVKVVVGYFNTNSYTALRPPTLETNALANERGQADIKIANAMRFDGLYPVNIYTYQFDAGENELILGKGRVLILGFIDAETIIEVHDAGIQAEKDGVPVDWLFY